MQKELQLQPFVDERFRKILVGICAWCKKPIRENDMRTMLTVEQSHYTVSHGICAGCKKKLRESENFQKAVCINKM